MPDYFETGFFVRDPFWHQLGTVLDEYPGRVEGMELAGHNFNVIRRPFFLGQYETVEGGPNDGAEIAIPSVGSEDKVDGWQALVRDDTGDILHVAKDSYSIIQNSVGWDVVDALVGEGAKYETGITLKGGAVCSVLAWLDEPTQVPGDNQQVFPYCNVAWSHDGSSALTARSTSIRTGCWNTQTAAEMQAEYAGTDFTFRHSRNVMERIDEAKMAIKGIRDSNEAYMEVARELAKVPVTIDQRELFVCQVVPMPEEALISDRVKGNIEEARQKLRNLFSGPTIPEEHALTGYGLQLAGVEYLDHLRGARNAETKFGRSLLRNEPAKAKLVRTIEEVAKA